MGMSRGGNIKRSRGIHGDEQGRNHKKRRYMGMSRGANIRRREAGEYMGISRGESMRREGKVYNGKEQVRKHAAILSKQLIIISSNVKIADYKACMGRSMGRRH